MTTGRLLMLREGAIGRLVLDNPGRLNAISFEMWERIGGVMDEFAADPEIRVVVLSGSGDKAFAAGADISKFEAEFATPEAVQRSNETIERAFQAIDHFPKPTIAEIRGYCIGGGMAIALCCDLRIAAVDARFGIPAARLGLGYDHMSVRRVISAAGPSGAKEILFTGKQFSADEAVAMGLVNRVVPVNELPTTVTGLAAMIAENAPLTLAAVKGTTIELAKDASAQDLAFADRLVAACFASEDYVEGRRAFMAKRKPQFKGR